MSGQSSFYRLLRTARQQLSIFFGRKIISKQRKDPTTHLTAIRGRASAPTSTYYIRRAGIRRMCRAKKKKTSDNAIARSRCLTSAISSIGASVLRSSPQSSVTRCDRLGASARISPSHPTFREEIFDCLRQAKGSRRSKLECFPRSERSLGRSHNSDERRAPDPFILKFFFFFFD